MFSIQFTAASRRGLPSSLRRYSSTPTSKPSIKLVAELRKLTETTISKAREALVATNNDVNGALEWLRKDLEVSGAKRAAKVEGRTANEGSIGVSVLSRGKGENTGALRAAMVELNCETDFVGRNELFGKLVADVAHTAAFVAEQPTDFKDFPLWLRPYPVDDLLDAPLLSQSNPGTTPSHQPTVGSAIRDTIAKVGEKITLRRVAVSVIDALPNQPHKGYRVASYIHGASPFPSQGRIGTLALIKLNSHNLPTLIKSDAFLGDLETLERSLARQIVGFDTRSISSYGSYVETALYEQPFMMFAGGTTENAVHHVLKTWAEQRGMLDELAPSGPGGVEVTEFTKWTVGENLEPCEVWVVSDLLRRMKHGSDQN